MEVKTVIQIPKAGNAELAHAHILVSALNRAYELDGYNFVFTDRKKYYYSIDYTQEGCTPEATERDVTQFARGFLYCLKPWR
jgi:uncharacterized protein with NRDE domain